MSNVLDQNFLVFEIAGKEFAMNLSIVDEVLPAAAITQVPNSPPFLMGLAGVRGKVMGVINGAARYGLSPSLCSHFIICKVRENITAIAVDRPVLAGQMKVRKVDELEKNDLQKNIQVDPKFLREAYELIQETEDKNLISTGRKFFEIDANLFVSDEMASKVGEA